jgi:prolipoprotein diacylglyceryltransferase
MYPVLFQIGNLESRSYGVIVAFSFLSALWSGTKEAKGSGLQAQDIQDFALYALVGGLIWALHNFHAGLYTTSVNGPREREACTNRRRGGLTVKQGEDRVTIALVDKMKDCS